MTTPNSDLSSWSPGRIWGREFRPFAFVISLSTARFTVSLLTATVYAVLL